MLRRGCTATSLSVPTQQQTVVDCLSNAFDVTSWTVSRSQGLDIYLYELGSSFPALNQMTIGKRCMTETSTSVSHEDFRDCDHDDIRLQCHFGLLLSRVKVCPPPFLRGLHGLHESFQYSVGLPILQSSLEA